MAHRHNCHWIDCTTIVPPSLWGCTKHFLLLPKPIRDELQRTYSPEDEEKHRPSPEYLKALAAAQNWMRHYKGG